jgi:DNA-binding transcriptional ArsR family regulator
MRRSKPCLVCQHPKRPEIDKALAAGVVSQARIGASYGLTQCSLSRHLRRCIRPAVAKALETRELITGTSLISNTLDMQALAHESAHKAALSENQSALAPLINSYHKGTELLAKLAGLEGFKPNSSTTNVAINAPGAQFGIVLPFQPALQAPETKVLAPAEVLEAELVES